MSERAVDLKNSTNVCIGHFCGGLVFKPACGLYLLLVIERVVGDLLHCLARSNNNVFADILLYVKGMLQQGK